MYATPTGAADSATKGYVDTAVSGFSGLLTGGSIRKIWAGADLAGMSSSVKAVVSSALILGDDLAFVMIPPSGSTSSSYYYVPSVLLPTSSDYDGEMMEFYFNGADVSSYGGWYRNGSQTVDGVNYPKYQTDDGFTIARRFGIGFIIVYSPVGFVYAD